MELGLISLNLKLEASSVKGKYPFTASITSGGKISDGYVGGTETVPGGPYRVLISTDLLAKKIKGLTGKAAFASEDLDSHADTITVGQFMDSWIEPVVDQDTGEYISLARASGLLESDDNENLVSDIVAGARKGLMGFSYDLKDNTYRIENINGEDVYVATDFEWLGATILKRDAAAYRNTRLAASKVKREDTEMGEKNKDGTQTVDVQAQVTEATKPILTAVEKVAEGFEAVTKAVGDVQDNIKSLTERVEASETKVKELEASPRKKKGKGGAPEVQATEPKPKLKDPAAKPEEGKGEVLSADAFADKIGDKIADKITAALQNLGGNKDPNNEGATEPGGGETLTGQRKTAGPARLAEHFVTLHAKGAEFGETGLGTVEGCDVAIAHVKEHVSNKEQRLAAISELAAAKRALKRGYHPRMSS